MSIPDLFTWESPPLPGFFLRVSQKKESARVNYPVHRVSSCDVIFVLVRVHAQLANPEKNKGLLVVCKLLLFVPCCVTNRTRYMTQICSHVTALVYAEDKQ